MNDVRELLGRAAEDAGQPDISTRAVYAKAARVRMRRRGVVSAAAFAAVAAGVVVVPGLSSGDEQQQEAQVAAPVELVGNSGRAKQLTEVLPKGVGKIEQVSLPVIINGEKHERKMEGLYGPLDGQFSVRKDGGVGYLVIGFMKGGPGGAQGPGSDPCEPAAGQPGPADCVNEKLPDGRVLTTWSDDMNISDKPVWGRELTGRLVLKDGGVLAVRASTGLRSERAQGPLLKNPPLTPEQLRTLLLSPELLPKKK
ncbi:hypothetical protein AADR41_08345 [Streptomyces sp. CLV115]|uniref:hypothetical protein n=1 Tax=Streptomyces sp. CLV115 TaxID=3138502 RepID=UPI00313CCE3B